MLHVTVLKQILRERNLDFLQKFDGINDPIMNDLLKDAERIIPLMFRKLEEMKNYDCQKMVTDTWKNIVIDDQNVGVANFTDDQLSHFVILEERKGYGTEFIRYCENKHFLNTGMKFFFLHVEMDARSFYEKNNYYSLAGVKYNDGIDHLMVKYIPGFQKGKFVKLTEDIDDIILSL